MRYWAKVECDYVDRATYKARENSESWKTYLLWLDAYLASYFTRGV